jgi:hypothetical protein
MDEVEEKLPRASMMSDTDNQTTIPAEEAPPHLKWKYRKFRAFNRGVHPWCEDNTEVVRNQDKLHLFDAIASRLDLGRYQQERGRKLTEDLDLSDMSGPGVNAEGLIWGICAVIANADVHDGTRYWPHPSSEKNCDVFRSVAEEFDLTRDQQMSVIQKVRARVDL